MPRSRTSSKASTSPPTAHADQWSAGRYLVIPAQPTGGRDSRPMRSSSYKSDNDRYEGGLPASRLVLITAVRAARKSSRSRTSMICDIGRTTEMPALKSASFGTITSSSSSPAVKSEAYWPLCALTTIPIRNTAPCDALFLDRSRPAAVHEFCADLCEKTQGHHLYHQGILFRSDRQVCAARHDPQALMA